MPTDEAFVTLATNDSYALGALVLGQSLKQVGTTRQLAILITSNVTDSLRHQVNALFDSVTFVNVLDSQDAENLQLLTRPDLGVTFTKLHCWRLTQYNKCVFLDADTLVVQNIDDLFEREELSAAPDVGWPDCFNSGVFVYHPSADTYRSLLSFAVTHGSFDGGDQGLLNAYFSDWATRDIRKRLPYVYNVVAQTFYSYKPALKQFGKDVKVIHFIGATKPWHLTYNIATQTVVSHGDQSALHSQEFLQLWWKIFIDNVKGHLDVNAIHLSGDLCLLTIYTQQQLGDQHRQYSWERGNVDYLGIDAFENIQKQLDSKLLERPSAGPAQPPKPVAQLPQAVAQPPKPVSPPPKAVAQPTSPVAQPTSSVAPKTAEPPKPVSPPPQAVAQPTSPVAQAPKPVSPPPQGATAGVKINVAPQKGAAMPPKAGAQAPAAAAAPGQAHPKAAGQKTSSITIVSSAKKPEQKK